MVSPEKCSLADLNISLWIDFIENSFQPEILTALQAKILIVTKAIKTCTLVFCRLRGDSILKSSFELFILLTSCSIIFKKAAKKLQLVMKQNSRLNT